VTADNTKTSAESDSLPANAQQLASMNGKSTGDVIAECFAEVTPVHTKQSESVAVHSILHITYIMH